MSAESGVVFHKYLYRRPRQATKAQMLGPKHDISIVKQARFLKVEQLDFLKDLKDT